ncbi:hypothetical protein RDI58_017610 [Solanum bulbocastanum]|uniref:S5 DRBM domain-containing protein n=1 Tax=Solanum bulbocastanum TaxID=147425 RepID=A0AAN8TEZ2_SOLBU
MAKSGHLSKSIFTYSQSRSVKSLIFLSDNLSRMRNGHVGLGVKYLKEVASAIRGEIILAKLLMISVRRGYWGNKIEKPHTVPCKVTGKYGSIIVRMVPPPCSAAIVVAHVPMKTYGFLTPDFWKEPCFTKSPFQEYFDILAKPANKVIFYATEEETPERVEA